MTVTGQRLLQEPEAVSDDDDDDDDDEGNNTILGETRSEESESEESECEAVSYTHLTLPTSDLV